MIKSAFSLIVLIVGLLIWQPMMVFADGATVRVTTGSVNNAGWEHNLVRGNPNLSHFGWFPVVSNVQGTMKVYPTKGPNLVQQQLSQAHRSICTKPIHVPTIIHRGPEITSAQSTNRKFGQKQVLAGLRQNNHKQDVHANLTKPSEVAVYNDIYSNFYANNNRIVGKLSNGDVHAQILRSGQSNNRQF